LPLHADPILWRKALDDKLAAEVTNRPIIEEYRNFPEEIPAYKTGADVYHAVRQQPRLADILRDARLNERSAYAKFVQARDDARRERAGQSVRRSALSRGALNRALSAWVKALKRTSKAERELIRVLEGK
jgi:hypothetical protein